MHKLIEKLQEAVSMLRIRALRAIASLGGGTIATLGVALLINIVSILYNNHLLMELEQQDMRIGQVRSSIIELTALRATLYSAESAQRGYLLVHRNEYLEVYNDAISKARERINRIRDLTVKGSEGLLTPEDEARMENLPQTMSAKSAEMQVTLGLALKGNVQMAKQVMLLGKGDEDMTRFFNQTQQLIDRQNQRLAGMEIDRSSSLKQARTYILGGALMQILLVALVIMQLLKQINFKSTLQLQLAAEIAKIELAYEEQSRMLSGLALQYQSYVERERHKLARELHDEVGSILTAVKMDLNWSVKKLQDSAPEVTEKLKKAVGFVDQGINFKRQIVEQLHPSVLTTLGLWPAMRAMVEDAAERAHWLLMLNLPAENVEISETIGLITYRVVQETLNNATKYAGATKVLVDILVDEHYVKLEIEDNGKGFDVDVLDGDTHGLAGMRHRVIAIGGKFDIISSPGKGTFTRAMIPVRVS